MIIAGSFDHKILVNVTRSYMLLFAGFDLMMLYLPRRDRDVDYGLLGMAAHKFS